MTTPATSDQKPAYDVTVWLESSLVLSRVTDACTTPITPTFADVETVVGCTVTVTRTWTAVDACTRSEERRVGKAYRSRGTPSGITTTTMVRWGSKPTASNINTAFAAATRA